MKHGHFMIQYVRAPFFRLAHRPIGRAVFLASTLSLIFSFFFFFTPSALALPPTRLLINSPALSFQDGVLQFTLSITVDDEEGLREIMKDGAVLELMTTVDVERERSWWANAKVFSRVYSSILQHDPLSRDFIVTFPEKDGERELRDRNLTRLLYESWKKLSFPILPAAALTRQENEAYHLHFTITLRHIGVPPWLEKNLFFWSPEVVPPENGALPIPPPED